MLAARPDLYHALIRTHHITSRKKVAALRRAADAHHCYALLRSGGCPGIMYCEGEEQGVRRWVDAVQNLRYKDYKLIVRPSAVPANYVPSNKTRLGRLEELSSVASFATEMESRGILQWWKKAMGYPTHED